MEDGHPRGPREPVLQPTTVISPRGNRKDKVMIPPPSTPQILATVVREALGRAAPHLALLGWHKSIELYEEVKILKERRRAEKEQAIQAAMQAPLDELFAKKQSQATAAARQLAEGLGVDLSQLKGSGAEGRITVEDVLSAKTSWTSRTP